MSHFTFNIADYRPMTESRILTIRDRNQAESRPAGFVILSPARTAEAHPMMSLKQPEVVDIRQIREAQRPHRGIAACVYQRRAKVLRFTGAGDPAVAVMHAPRTGAADGEFGSLDLPPAA